MKFLLTALLLLPTFSVSATHYCHQAQLAHELNVNICIDDNLSRDTAFGCGRANFDSTLELYCLLNHIPADVSKRCGDADLTPNGKIYCMSYAPSAQTIQHCVNQNLSLAQEATCIERGAE